MNEDLDVPDETLDAIVSEAHSIRTRQVEEPTDDELVRYVSGDLDRSRAREIRRDLLRSSALRQRTADVARVLEEVTDPDISRRFDESRVPHIPRYRELTEERTDGESVLRATTILLTPRHESRPAEEATLAVRLSASVDLLEILIPVSFLSPNPHCDVLITGPERFREEYPDWAEFTDAPGGARLRVLLEAAKLPRGLLRIEVRPRVSSQGKASELIYWLEVLEP